MRIAIVNPTTLAIETLKQVVLASGRHEVAWVARTTSEAVGLCTHDRPELILMDLFPRHQLLGVRPEFTPEMDGVGAIRRIMASTPCAIVVVTANLSEHTARVFEAMGAGALDVANTPGLGESSEVAQGDVDVLLAKIKTIERLIGAEDNGKSARVRTLTSSGQGAAGGQTKSQNRASGRALSGLVVMGASAGGPAAVARILSDCPANFEAAVAIVQHVDVRFARGLADWLAGQTSLRVRLAEEGDQPEAGTVLLAGRQSHLAMGSSMCWEYKYRPAECVHRPSVDILFESVGEHWKGMAVGVLLTGMGRDGAAGLQSLRKHGHYTIAQDRTTSAVYGMPKAAAELNAATEILALDKIGARLTNIVAGKIKP